jgi:hypothetical protein
MTRRLFVHVGPPKTGTSAIQFLFRDLSDPALTYPATGQWPDGSHNRLVFALRGAKRWGPIEIPPIAELAPLFAKDLRDAPRDALISSEGLSHPGTYRKLLDTLADTVAGFDEVIPILTLRHPLERAASAYNQRVKDAQFGERALPDEDLRRSIAGHRLCPLIDQWRQNVPGVQLLPYGPAESIVARFCALIDRPDLAPAAVQWRNRSLGGVGLSLLLIANRVLPDAGARHRFLTTDMRSYPGLRLWRGASFPYSEAASALAMDEVVGPDLAEVQARHGIDLGEWRAPPRATLSEAERTQVRDAARTLLPASDGLEAEVEAVLAAFPAG